MDKKILKEIKEIKNMMGRRIRSRRTSFQGIKSGIKKGLDKAESNKSIPEILKKDLGDYNGKPISEICRNKKEF